MKPSILRNLGIAFIAFGLAMGVIFPLYAQFFVDWKPGMKSWFILGCLVAGTTIGIVNYLLVKFVLLRKLRRIADVANAIADKDLSHSCSLESHDVVGEIVNSFNRMAETLRTMVTRVNEATNSLNAAASQLAENTGHSNLLSQQQQQQTQQMVVEIHDMAEGNRAVAESAEESVRAADISNRHSQEGQRVVEATINDIRLLAEEMASASQVIGELEQQSESIGAVLDVIRAIAEQTNLLALNAAIESARAGEAGRGFAVVADEVRNLASRTQQSTEEIHTMIERLQTGTGKAVQVMQQSHEHSNRSREQVAQAGNSLKSLASAITDIDDINRRIASAAEQQQVGAESLSQRVDRISEMAEETVREIHRVAEAGEQLSALAQQLHSYVADFRT